MKRIKKMSEILFGIGVGLIFGIGALVGLGILIGIGYIIEWYEGRTK
tara:strand:- start:255 stop:395 length:141 start_codon:yes stop_codon:yes gene_type:complete